MNFLNPLILYALTAISIPILIHFFNLRKVRKVEFSTLMFIKEIQKSKLRRIKLKQLLLLFFRIMLIVFLVLAFSNPVYEGYAGDAGSMKKKALIFVDDSFSMNVKDEKGLYFEQAKETLKDILRLFKESDEVYIMPTSEITMREKKILYNDFGEILDSIGKASSSYKSLSTNEIINFTDELLEKKSSLINEVYIVSDFQRSNFDNGLTSKADFENITGDNVSLYLVNIGRREANNLSVDGIYIKSKIIEKDKSVKLKADITNYSKFNVYDKTVHLIVDNNLVSESVIDIGSLETKEVEFNFRPGRSGSIAGFVQLIQNEFADDEISEDNKYYFTLDIPEIFNVGIIEDNPSDSRFVRLALETAKKIASDSSVNSDGLFNVSQFRKITKDINKYEMVFIINRQSFSANESEILSSYIENGGGVFIFPGKDIDVQNYNNVLLRNLDAFRLNRLVYNDKQNEQTLKFENIDFQHPILTGIFQDEKLSITKEDFGIESPVIKSYFEILMNDDSFPIITLSNKANFLVETKTLNGSLLFSAVSATNDMSDFPMKSIFAPLIIRSVYYLGGKTSGEVQYTLGKKNIIQVKDLNQITNLVLPDGGMTPFSVTVNSEPNEDIKTEASDENINFVSLPYTINTETPGIYSFRDSVTENSYLFALNRKKEESKLEKADEDYIDSYFEETGFENVKYISEPSLLAASVTQERQGIELWKYFLIAAFIFLLLELYYSKKLEND